MHTQRTKVTQYWQTTTTIPHEFVSKSKNQSFFFLLQVTKEMRVLFRYANEQIMQLIIILKSIVVIISSTSNYYYNLH